MNYKADCNEVRYRTWKVRFSSIATGADFCYFYLLSTFPRLHNFVPPISGQKTYPHKFGNVMPP